MYQRFFKCGWLLAVMGVLGLNSVMVAQKYIADSQKSRIEWLGQKIAGEHRGIINLKNGELIVKDGNMTGNFVLDMNSIKNTDLPKEGKYNQAKLEGHLKSDDFFGVKKYPLSTFKIKKIMPYKAQKEGKANYRVTGDLTIKGITKEIAFPAYMEFNGKKIAVSGTVEVDRSLFDVRYGSGSFFELATLKNKLIYDIFYLTLNISGSVK